MVKWGCKAGVSRGKKNATLPSPWLDQLTYISKERGSESPLVPCRVTENVGSASAKFL